MMTQMLVAGINQGRVMRIKYVLRHYNFVWSAL